MKKTFLIMALMGLLTLINTGCHRAESQSNTLQNPVDAPKQDSQTQQSYEQPIDHITIKGVEYSTSLVSLELVANGLSNEDIVPLGYMKNLKVLDLTGNQIDDISPLSGLANLEELYLFSNGISDITPLTGLTNLKSLMLRSNNISDILSLADLVNLESLRLEENWISDIAPLAGLTNLKSLNLGENQINDITPLSGLASLEGIVSLQQFHQRHNTVMRSY